MMGLNLYISAQTDTDSAPYSVNEGTLIGIGQYNIYDSYLSDSKYTGRGFSIINERMKMVSAHPRFSSQQIFHVNMSSTENPAHTIGLLSGFVDYSYGYHYRFQPADRLKLLAGASVGGMLGFMYNTQGSNNSIAIHADIDLNLSAAALYTLYLRNYPITFRYQIDAPIAGVLFMPEYGQSYYEIFSLGNTSGVIRLSSIQNKRAMRNFLTIDLPLRSFTLRMGYTNSVYYLNDAKMKGSADPTVYHHISHNLMIGLVKEFISFGGKKSRNKNLYQSAYY